MGSHFHEWIDYHGVAFSIEWVAHFLIFGVRQLVIFTVSKWTRIFVLWVKSEVFFIQVTKLGSSQKLHICPKVIKMESITGHRIDYNGVGALRGQRHISSKN